MWPALPFCLVASAAAELLPLRSLQGRRLSVPAQGRFAEVLGVQLEAIHVHQFTADTLVHVRHPVEHVPRVEGGRVLASTSRRSVVRILAKLSLSAYASHTSFSEEVMAPILSAGESLYGPNITTYAEEVAQQDDYFAELLREFDGSGSVVGSGLGIDAVAQDSVGVHALEFESPSLGRVLVFRGSYSQGDSDNLKPWITDWVLMRMTAMMKQQWITLAGLPWTKQLRADQATFLRRPSEASLTDGSNWFNRSFLSDLGRLAEEKGLSASKVRETGYWEFTKVIADSVRSSLSPGENLTITGHSQGGTRAALVSMWFEKKHGEKYDTVTFAATGSLCFPRDLHFTGGDMLEDVDPYMMHEQITEYVHPLDVKGFLDYDAGKVCLYGTTGVAESAARKYCEHVFGHRGVDVLVADNQELANEFQRCQYFTHTGLAVSSHLMDDSLLLEDGTTDGGCSTRANITQDDPRMLCPVSSKERLDSCAYELSCETCGISISESGLDCRWCEEAGSCLSTFDVLFFGCISDWRDPDVVCPVGLGAGLTPLLPLWACICLWWCSVAERRRHCLA